MLDLFHDGSVNHDAEIDVLMIRLVEKMRPVAIGLLDPKRFDAQAPAAPSAPLSAKLLGAVRAALGRQEEQPPVPAVQHPAVRRYAEKLLADDLHRFCRAWLESLVRLGADSRPAGTVHVSALEQMLPRYDTRAGIWFREQVAPIFLFRKISGGVGPLMRAVKERLAASERLPYEMMEALKHRRTVLGQSETRRPYEQRLPPQILEALIRNNRKD